MKTECSIKVIYARLRAACALRGTSMPRACAAIGRPRLFESMSRGYETSILSIYKLCEYLDVSIDYICGRTEHMGVWRD